MSIDYPLYSQRKALREASIGSRGSMVVIAVYAALIAVILVLVSAEHYGAGAVVFGASWLMSKFLLDKHPSDITREQFERASGDLEVVSLALYRRVEDGTDFDRSPESERFYDAYTAALASERSANLGEFWEAVRRAESTMRDWNAATV